MFPQVVSGVVRPSTPLNTFRRRCDKDADRDAQLSRARLPWACVRLGAFLVPCGTCPVDRGSPVPAGCSSSQEPSRPRDKPLCICRCLTKRLGRRPCLSSAIGTIELGWRWVDGRSYHRIMLRIVTVAEGTAAIREPVCVWRPDHRSDTCSAPAAWVDRRRTADPRHLRERWFCEAHRELGAVYEPEAWSPVSPDLA